ncbi:hypothetical protein AGR1B_pAt30058 [Agrobacterium fabacearum S56]|nr:hypothetical protein AGR1B_pAt30058 [Agrobacterium fabacearum S56]
MSKIAVVVAVYVVGDRKNATLLINSSAARKSSETGCCEVKLHKNNSSEHVSTKAIQLVNPLGSNRRTKFILRIAISVIGVWMVHLEPFLVTALDLVSCSAR